MRSYVWICACASERACLRAYVHIGTIDLYHCVPLSKALAMAKGHTVSGKYYTSGL